LITTFLGHILPWIIVILFISTLIYLLFFKAKKIDKKIEEMNKVQELIDYFNAHTHEDSVRDEDFFEFLEENNIEINYLKNEIDN